MNEMRKDRAVILAYGRSAIGKARKGAFAGTHPMEFAAQVAEGVLQKVPGLKREEIDDIVLGTAGPYAELGWNAGRILANRLQLPDCVPGQTVNRFCSSGLQAVVTANNAITCGQADLVLAGGVEYMSSKGPMPDLEMADPWLLEHAPGVFMPMGLTAENVAEKYGISREEMDAFAVASHQKAYAAQQAGYLGRSIIPVQIQTPEGTERIVDQDEGIRPNTTLEGCAGLRPAFREDGRVTAATSSQVSDGAAFVVLASQKKADELGIKPVAALVDYCVAGCDPTLMGTGPIYAVPKLLERNRMSIDDMDVIELNEAFAAQAIPCIRELKMDPERVNPWGGAIALGHPMGATGGILLSKALDYLRINGGNYALITMCIGGGMGAAGLFEVI